MRVFPVLIICAAPFLLRAQTNNMLASTNLLTPASNWMNLGPVNADGSGNWQFDDATNSPQRFY